MRRENEYSKKVAYKLEECQLPSCVRMKKRTTGKSLKWS